MGLQVLYPTDDDAIVMIGSAREGGIFPAKTPRAAGARMVVEPSDTEYGTREYAAYDCEDYWWTFGTYRPQGDAV